MHRTSAWIGGGTGQGGCHGGEGCSGHARWKAWILDGIEAGARNSHRFLRVPEAWRPTTTLTTGGMQIQVPMGWS